ncbi:unnamed protein product, partial [Rotaria magnacalcarata]
MTPIEPNRHKANDFNNSQPIPPAPTTSTELSSGNLPIELIERLEFSLVEDEAN